MINKTKLEAINSAVKELDEVKMILETGGEKLISLTYQDKGGAGVIEIDTSLFTNAFLFYRDTLTAKLEQLGYEENYVEVTTREGGIK